MAIHQFIRSACKRGNLTILSYCTTDKRIEDQTQFANSQSKGQEANGQNRLRIRVIRTILKLPCFCSFLPYIMG